MQDILNLAAARVGQASGQAAGEVLPAAAAAAAATASHPAFAGLQVSFKILKRKLPSIKYVNDCSGQF